MKSAWLFLTAACAVAISSTASAQTPTPSAAEILKADRPLQINELKTVIAAAQAAMSGKVVRLSYAPGGPGPEILIGENGRPRYMRGTSGYGDGGGHVDVKSYTEYTGRAARKCDGTPLKAELVVEYERKSIDNRWTVTARAETSREVLKPLFDMLAGTAKVELGGVRSFDDRVARALVAPWTPPPGGIGGPPDGTRQSLWIDTVSLLPLRWSLLLPPGAGVPEVPEYGLSFAYDASLDLRPPDGVPAPDCVR
jgi:hypothetical protein